MNIKKTRKAISPVLATVILIAITLIASIAIAGFVFGLFGSFTSTAQVTVVPVTCNNSPNSPGTLTCTLTIKNTGSSSTSVTAVFLAYGTQVPGTGCSPVVSAGQSTTCTAIFNLTPTTSTIPVGQAVQGSITLSNGASVPWSGTVAS
jgi:flagellin-like protein